ncbi:MAG: hybrid sensor histidine kinase/response regulator [Microcoleaceae cyanobacterium]
MSMPNITTLKKFISSIPICLNTEKLQVVWSIFSRGTFNELVVVNQQYQPLGLIYLHSFIPYILANDHSKLPLSDPSDGQNKCRSEAQSPQTDAQTFNWQQPLSEVSSLMLDSIRILPADLSLAKLWPHLESKSEVETNEESAVANFCFSGVPIALVDCKGEFVGLLDSLRLLEFIANTRENQNPQWRGEDYTSYKENNKETVPKSATHQKFILHPQVGVGNKNLASQNQPETSDYLSSTIELLEKLPLPLMLQSSEGRVINQNLAWRSQVETESELMEVADVVGRLSAYNTKLQPTEIDIPDSLSLLKDTTRLSCPATTNWRFSPTKLLQEQVQLPKSKASSSWCYPGSQPNTYVCVCPQKNGQERIWQFSSQPLFDLTLVLAQDITEQHLVAKELEAKNADLIQLNRLKDEFLACISHELKTPLTAVLGLSSLLKDQRLGKLNDRQARYAHLIHQSGRHLMAVVNDILDLTRMETGQMELNPEPVKIREVCERAFQDAFAKAQSPSQIPDAIEAEFSLEIESGLNVLIADELRLRQMLANLLSNALKFTPSDGKMGLKVSLWERWVAFTVWDNGIGIPEDKQHLIFQKFQQLENPMTREFEGTGLGLVLTQRLAHLHGGDVTFISREGKGSEFTLILPPSPPQKDLETEPSQTDDYLREQGLIPHKTTGASIKKHSKLPVNNYQLPVGNYCSRLVLIVEAVPRFIEDFTNKLSALGYRVVIARSGTEAVEKARKLQPKLIFLNPLLPLLSGWDVLTLLKTDSDTCQIPIIITATRGDKERTIINGANNFLSLPVQQLALKKILAEYDEFKTVISPQKLVVLRLIPGKYDFPSKTQEESIYDDKILSLPAEYRVIEADDLAQANLLAKIWHPHVILIERVSDSVNPVQFINKLSKYSNLTAIPLVTLDYETTQAANQVKELSVFPFLAVEKDSENLAEIEVDNRYLTSALSQVISLATGMSGKPTILVMDVATIQDFAASLAVVNSPQENNFGDKSYNSPTSQIMTDDSLVSSEVSDRESMYFHQNWTKITMEGEIEPEQIQFSIDSTQALVQYIQTSGFRSLVSKSWVEVFQQLEHHSVDLLLICLGGKLPSGLDKALSNLEHIAGKPPILVLEDSNYQLPKNLTSEKLNLVLSKIATKILPASVSIADLLKEIKDNVYE